MLNTTTFGAGAIHLAFDNTARFDRSERKGKLSLLNGGLAPKTFEMAKSAPANAANRPTVDSFWAERHSPNSTAGGTTEKSQMAVAKKTKATHPGGNDFWAQRHLS
ncbi:MAG: hypothetical protein P4L53_06430 [Candidatus Obscuribacterales bacterium]|nr:hypothetical protein [Candidatus Obscuribacterales bacterium]